MARFTGFALALALIVGCAKQSKESRTAEPVTPTQGGAPNADTRGGEGGGGESPKTGAQPVESPTVPTPGNKPLDPSANADPNDPKQQARANGVLGNTDKFDDSPIDKQPEKGTGKVGATGDGANPRPTAQLGQARAAFQLDTPDAAVKAALEAQQAAITGCHKTATGMLEIAITIDANGKVTSAKIAAASTLKDKATRDCVLAIVKKLQLGKDAKVTKPIRITFN